MTNSAETKKAVVKKIPKVNVAALKRELAGLYDQIATMNERNAKTRRDCEAAERELVNAEGARDDLQKQFDRISTVIQFRLSTVYPFTGNNYDNYGNPVPQHDRESEEEAVLREIMDMVQNVPLKREYTRGDSPSNNR